jgi:hypothetical protein
VAADVRDELPAELSPWTRRSLDRVGALRSSMPLLGPTDEVRALPPASEPLPIGPADFPQLADPEPQSKLEPARLPAERRRSRAATYGPAVIAAPLGAAIAAAGAAADVAVVAVGGAAAVAAAVLAIALGRRR